MPSGENAARRFEPRKSSPDLREVDHVSEWDEVLAPPERHLHAVPDAPEFEGWGDTHVENPGVFEGYLDGSYSAEPWAEREIGNMFDDFDGGGDAIARRIEGVLDLDPLSIKRLTQNALIGELVGVRKHC